ncbi:Putative zinc-finger [Granulicella pectinivorans]|uniref:Putative zinc-finger n=1 Tax=Granulicella pectinivorans TaxID=474950 RepID=A0A1I6LVK7_9BACT|nr:zf-HC2 domain-containing protein [Granulicella pectinivorans]SFS07475.1 Putative zinc-finger [Granulicella pectinivorans]
MHLSDEDVLRLLDREASPAEADRMRGHVAECAACGERVASARRTMDEVGAIFGGEARASLGARRRLEGALRRSGAGSRPRSVGWAVAACFLLAAVGLGWWGGSGRHAGGDVGSVPNLSLTPGAIRTVSLSEICSAADDDDDLDPVLPASIQHAVFQEYGIAAAGMEKNYQIDYLVNPQLGGTDDIRNLWPQAYQGGVWNARAKDQLEERLHQMVCNQTIDLGTAQRAITTDWIAAYKKYVQDGPRT